MSLGFDNQIFVVKVGQYTIKLEQQLSIYRARSVRSVRSILPSVIRISNAYGGVRARAYAYKQVRIRISNQ